MKAPKSKVTLLLELLAEITEESRRLIGVLGICGADADRLHRELNPKMNMTYRRYVSLARVLKLFAPGEIEDGWLTEWHSEAMKLIVALKNHFPTIMVLNTIETVQVDFYNFLCEPYVPDMTQTEYDDEVDDMLKNLEYLYLQNTDALFILRAEQLAAKAKGKKSKAGRPKNEDKEFLIKFIEDMQERLGLERTYIVEHYILPNKELKRKMHGLSVKSLCQEASKRCRCREG